MKVELVKVKINKLKEVKKQLRKRKCSIKKNLKNLLLDNEEKEHEDDIFYQSINAIFQDDKNNNETIHPSKYSDNLPSDYHIDLEDVLESLGACQNDISQEGLSESLSIKEPNISTERREESINLTKENQSMDSFSSLVNEDNSNGEHQGDETYLCDNIETECLLFFNSNKEPLESTINTYSTKSELDMVELGNYYIPDTVFETTNDPTIEMDDFCNQIEISISENLNKENTDEQVEPSEIGDTEMADLNYNLFEGDINNHTEYEEISDTVRGVAMINPLLVSIPEADLQTMALYQLQQKNDSEEIDNVGETELLKNYSWEQKANIIAAAKMLYTKRTRTLLHWLDPKLPLPKLRATLELSWQNLPLWQKEVYITQVMGPLVMEIASPMLNPQLKSGGFKMSTPPSPKKPAYERKRFSDFITDP